MWANIKQILRPRGICVLCGARVATSAAICCACEGDLPQPINPCKTCGNECGSGQVCGQCLREAPSFDAAIAAFRYVEPVSWLVQGLKFNQKLVFGRILADALARTVSANGKEPPQVIIPVPLHRSRQRARGFNQALELARVVAARTGVPLDHQLATRSRATDEQSMLDAGERKSNVRGAFAVRPMRWSRVAIVDDVMTTGHTADELARSLKQAGCEQVQVWVAARASR